MGEITISAWGKDVTISFPDDMDGQAPAAFVSQYDYEDMVLDENENEIPNPLSHEEFTIHKIFDYIQDVMRAAGMKAARDAAADTARLEIQAQLDQIDLLIEDGGG